MTFLKSASTVFCLALVGGMFSPSAKADDRDKKTTITFSGPVEIPPVYITGMRILPAANVRVQTSGLFIQSPHRPDLQQGTDQDYCHRSGDSKLPAGPEK